jgi:hypothetical protein
MESSFRKGPAGEAASRKVATRDVASIEVAAAATEVTAAATARSAATPAVGKGQIRRSDWGQADDERRRRCDGCFAEGTKHSSLLSEVG